MTIFQARSNATRDAMCPQVRDSSSPCIVRYWTMAEIWMSMREAGLEIVHFEELPHHENVKIPGNILLKLRNG